MNSELRLRGETTPLALLFDEPHSLAGMALALIACDHPDFARLSLQLADGSPISRCQFCGAVAHGGTGEWSRTIIADHVTRETAGQIETLAYSMAEITTAVVFLAERAQKGGDFAFVTLEQVRELQGHLQIVVKALAEVERNPELRIVDRIAPLVDRIFPPSADDRG